MKEIEDDSIDLMVTSPPCPMIECGIDYKSPDKIAWLASFSAM